MNVSKGLLLIVISGLLASVRLSGQASNSRNISFELGNFTNWVGYTWRHSDASDVPSSFNTKPVAGLVSRRQVIMTDTSAYDSNTGYALRKIPRGYKYCARLGDEIISGDPMPRCWQQSLRYTMTIDSSNALLILKFALVLQYASTHNMVNEPRFKLTLYDSKGNVLPDCSNYDVFASNKYVKGFKTYVSTGTTIPPNTPVNWRDWTTVGADLLAYVGQTITVEFMATDCTEHYHFGYAYFLAECHPMYITTKFCAGDTVALLTAPEGFESYRWKDNSGSVIDTNRIITLNVPKQQTDYSCTLTSATGCVVTLKTKLLKYAPKADFSSFMLDCNSNTVQFINNSTKTNGTLAYNWDFGDGNNAYIKNPSYSFATSGMHTVSLMLTNPPSSCADTLTKKVESFSPPLVGIDGDSTYCPGLSTTLKAYGAYEYTWSTGSKNESVEVSAPGGLYWLLGKSSTGCISDTIYKSVNEEPDWPFIATGDTVLCGDENTVLSASGAVSCRWTRKVSLPSSGADNFLWTRPVTGDTIPVSVPGIYVATGKNVRGCEKSVSFKVSRYALPSVDFLFSPDALDRKHMTLTCTSKQEAGVNYTWNMGDNSAESGAVIQHTYTYPVPDTTLWFLVKMLAISSHGCHDTISKYIDIVPFIPNVFSPNNDGMNDIFMEGFRVEIVDRNGMKIYEGINGWDGRYKGKMADPDTYFYLVYYSDSEQKLHTRKGYVTLIR